MSREAAKSRILIVDDRPANLVAMRALLDQLNHAVVEAKSGKEALSVLLHQSIDLVLLDVNMPDLDGFETARLIRQRTPAALLPILFVSAREPSPSDLEEGYALGAVDYITKPVVPNVLRGKVTALLDLQRRGTDLERSVRERTAELKDLNDRATALRETIGELEAFSYSLSHDMRAPLRAIHGFARALQADYGDGLPEEGRDYVGRILTATKRLDRMITDVLSYSRMNVEPITLGPVDVEAVIRAAIEQNPKLQSPHAEIRIESPLGTARGHEGSLNQCMANLLGNAVKFVAPGVIPKVRIWTEQAPGATRIWIEDNGIGIAPENQERIFQAFERLNANYEGTGFGLAITRKAISRMNGRFGVESAVGKGSRFWIELPTAESNGSILSSAEATS